jgi:hypothetical protein
MNRMQRLILSTLLLFAAGSFCVSAEAQGAQRQATALGNASSVARILAYAQVKVCSYNSSNPTACTSTVTLYKDPAMTVPYSTNPIQADKNGNYSYWVTAGNYVEQMCATGTSCQTQVVTLGGAGGGTVTVTPNQGVASNGSGTIVSAPEVGWSTDGSGNTTQAWVEDLNRGLFDARRPRVEKIDGNNTVVTLASNPALALQEVANEMNCFVSRNHRAATIFIPPGKFQVGVTAAPTLTFGPGMNVIGTAGGTIGVGGSNNEGGTIFTSPFTDSGIFRVDDPQTSTCADGTTATNSFDGGNVENIQVQGTVNTGGAQSPGSPYTGNAGPHQTGIFIGLAHGTGRNLRAAYTGGTGIDANGQDSDFYDLWAFDTQAWLRFDRGSGITYNPSTDGMHGGVENNSGDGRIHSVETYGTFNTPGTEFGHLCGLVVGGGGQLVDKAFVQIDEYGICIPSTAAHVLLTNVRSEGHAGPAIFAGSSSSVITHFQASQGCKFQAGVTARGYCDDVEDASASGGFWTAGDVFDNPPLGTSFRTGYVAAGQGSWVNVPAANGDQIDRSGAVALGAYPGVNMTTPEMDRAEFNGGSPLTGSSPDVGRYVHVLMQNGSSTNITSLTNERIGQHLYISLASANDILVAPESGGNFYSCTGHNIVGPSNSLEFFVFNTGSPVTIFAQANCQAVDQDFWQVNFANQATPSVQSLSMLDVIGTAQFRPSAVIGVPNITTAGSPGTFTYSYAYKAWVGGSFSFSQIATESVTPPATTGPLNNVKILVALPSGTTHYELYRQATTDPSFTPGLISQGDVATNGHPAVAQTLQIFDTNTAPINTNIIPSGFLGITTTGGLIIGRAAPTSATEPTQQGEVYISSGSGFAGAGVYVADATNHWTHFSLTGSSETVTFSATPTFSTATLQSYIVLTGNITSFTLAAGIDGQPKTLTFCQDATGGRTVASPANVHGFLTWSAPTASKCASQHFSYSVPQTAWLADSPGVINE